MFKKIIVDDINKTVEKKKTIKQVNEQIDYEVSVNEHQMRRPRFNIPRIITYSVMLFLLLIIILIFIVL